MEPSFGANAPQDDDGATAQRHMRCGLALLAVGSHEATSQAIVHFERAIELREITLDRLCATAVEESVEEARWQARYDLAAAWLNRAAALANVTAGGDDTDVLSSLDAAVALLEGLPVTTHPPFASRLAVALHNRAQYRLRSGSETWRAIPDVVRALDLFPLDDSVDARRGAAAAWTTLAEAQLREPAPDAWLRAAQSAAHAVSLALPGDVDPLVARIRVRAERLVDGARQRLAAAGNG